MNKLIEMVNAGVSIVIYGGPRFGKDWEVKAEKDDDGIELKITSNADVLADAINDTYEKWVKITGRGYPALGLKQIEHRPITPPPAKPLDDEIPF